MTQENSFLSPLERYNGLKADDIQAYVVRGRELRAQAIRDHGAEFLALLARIFSREKRRSARAGEAPAPALRAR